METVIFDKRISFVACFGPMAYGQALHVNVSTLKTTVPGGEYEAIVNTDGLCAGLA